MALSILSPDSLDLTQDFAGIHLGGTGSANQLDDYETGTWTPTPAIGTFSGDVEGYYTKIGRLVHVHCHVQSISDTTSSNGFDVNGLPFSPSTDPDSYSGSVMTRYLNVTGTEMGLTSYLAGGTTHLRVYALIVGGTYIRVTHANYSNGGIGLRMGLTYITD